MLMLGGVLWAAGFLLGLLSEGADAAAGILIGIGVGFVVVGFFQRRN